MTVTHPVYPSSCLSRPHVMFNTAKSLTGLRTDALSHCVLTTAQGNAHSWGLDRRGNREVRVSGQIIIPPRLAADPMALCRWPPGVTQEESLTQHGSLQYRITSPYPSPVAVKNRTLHHFGTRVLSRVSRPSLCASGRGTVE